MSDMRRNAFTDTRAQARNRTGTERLICVQYATRFHKANCRVYQIHNGGYATKLTKTGYPPFEHTAPARDKAIPPHTPPKDSHETHN